MTEIRIYHYGRFRCEGGIGNTDCLLQHALAAWNVHADRPVRLPAAVCRTQNGKPVIEGAAVSVAHTGTDWYCACSACPLGLDVERIRPVNWQRLAARFYTVREQAACQDQAMFFRIWCRKEALVKFWDRTLGYGLSRFETCDEAGLRTVVMPLEEGGDQGGKTAAYLRDLSLGPQLAGAAAVADPCIEVVREEMSI